VNQPALFLNLQGNLMRNRELEFFYRKLMRNKGLLFFYRKLMRR